MKAVILLALALCLRASPATDAELVLLACSHAAQVFVLDNMDILEWQFVVHGKPMDALTKETFAAYQQQCTKSTSPEQAWSYFNEGTALLKNYTLDGFVVKEEKTVLENKARGKIAENAKKNYIALVNNSAKSKISYSLFLIIGVIILISIVLTCCIPKPTDVYGPIREY
eukprot:TRINITY_DN5739_c0_g1_i14.p1 TRINITY_DN5739_c0_g1~~TRINITY_DN5739_c0_g1_i14.p1  ORF type:complete len:170 (+),score=43.82 TRINITY_DN5739_c0_g1_i14:624-1133(+)